MSIAVVKQGREDLLTNKAGKIC